MVITEQVLDEVVEADPTPPQSPRRKMARRFAVAGAAVLVAAAGLGIAVAARGDSNPPVPAAPSKSSDEVVRDLVERGVVPGASLSDGSRVNGSAVTARAQDQVVRDLVARGLVPAATLSDGSHIAAPSAAPSQDDVVRELVARGFVPAATLDDGTEISG